EEEEEGEEDSRGKKRKKPTVVVESLNLSLSLPDVLSLSLAPRSSSLSHGDTFSNDFTAATSLSHHNPSCSLAGDNSDQFRNCGEGTNGSVHSRFRPPPPPQAGDYKVMSSTASDDNVDLVKLSRERVSEAVPSRDEAAMASLREYLRIMIDERRDELRSLQLKLLDRSRPDLTKCHRSQLEILVAIKTGVSSFLDDADTRIPSPELVQIFSLERCRNVLCRRSLPVDDCDCRICSSRRGFCSECMCPVCFDFDCASNTCSWVGCDTCSHWCHAKCALRESLIKPGPTTVAGETEMLFHCLGCGHASEMFGFVKDVFMSCAENWGVDALTKELDCVERIFRGSRDRKGKELHHIADEMLAKLRNKIITPPEVCRQMFRSFKTADSFPGVDHNGFAQKSPSDLRILLNEKNVADEWSVKPAKKDNNSSSFDNLESLIKMKEAEARMFETKADEARKDAENYKRMVRLHLQKSDEEYGEKLSKLCLQETEERRRRKMEELKALQNSHCDYYKMKIRMQSEISALLKRMEATNQQL
ncbi:hypothetical protein M569_05208, partial [Genlisea aurea]